MASSSKQIMFPSFSNSSPTPHNYDVFLNFRGADTRKRFVSFLYEGLRAKEINTFKDDNELEEGDHLPTELSRAIEGSKLAVVVLSENYTSSKWCLMELELIMELYKRGTLKVFPIFYEIDPSNVRKQRGSFALKPYREKKSTAGQIPGWTKALTLIGNLKGVDSRKQNDESAMVQEIVNKILSRLPSTQLTCLDDVVCMEAHTERMKRLLEIESEGDARMVGIWGMGGTGKTTIANYLYHQFARGFPAHCFIDVNKISTQVDLKGLQTQFLRAILRSKHVVALKDEQQGANFIQSKLGALKVFVVLDGVDKMEQLYALAREARWFGRGSRIIITTRDKRLLDSYRDVNIYKVECLESQDSLKMFKHFALTGRDPPFPEYDDQLAIEASQLAHGLPVALKALGLYFRGTTSRTQWEAEMHTFGRSLHQDIMHNLRCSYTNLENETKVAFLRIACLFSGEPVSRVSALLNESRTSIKVLTDKSLIHISSDGCIDMHSLIQQMGREVIREESDNTPQKQAILWDTDSSYAVLKGNTGTEKIEGMALHICKLLPGSTVDGSPFNNMHNLKFLKFFKHLDVTGSNLDLSSDSCILPPCNLRLLHWDAYPLPALPPKFPLYYLVELRLRYSNLKHLWEGQASLPVLKILDVTGSKNLIKLPDLSFAPNLEELITKGCTGLTQILETTDRLTTLRKLDVSQCDNLRKLDMTIREFPELGKSNGILEKVAERFPDAAATTISLTNLSVQCQLIFRLKHLKGKADHLYFSSEQRIRCALMVTKAQKTSDLYIDFYGFKSVDIMNFTYKKDGRSFAFDSFSKFVCLTELNLINLNMHVVEDDIGLLQELQKLDLTGNDFPHLPKEMDNLSKLKSLRLCNCRILRDLPQLTQLETLKLSDCINLRWFPHGSKKLLQNLWLDNCKEVRDLSETLSSCTNLRYLDLSRNDIGTMPASITLLPLLVTLSLNDCNNLKSLTQLPWSIKYLYAQRCKTLESVDLPLGYSLKHIDVSYCPKLNDEDLIHQFLTCGRNDEVSQRFAFLPGSIVPSYFDNQATQNRYTSESAGLDACIKISCASPFHLQLSPSSYSCEQEGNGSYRINLKPDIFIPSQRSTTTTSSSNQGEEFSKDHLLIFHIPGNVNIREFHLNTHIQLPEEFQSTLSKTVSYRIRVKRKSQEDDRVHDISCLDISEKREPEGVDNGDEESISEVTTNSREITERSGDKSGTSILRKLYRFYKKIIK